MRRSNAPLAFRVDPALCERRERLHLPFWRSAQYLGSAPTPAAHSSVHSGPMSERADRIVSLYERHASRWAADRARRPWVEKAWHDRFVEALPRGATVLDLGCGSGFPAAAYMAERGLKVTGVDASPTLISLCRARLPDHEWHVADMRCLSLERRFDGILAWDSFFHLPPDDQRRMFPIFGSHAGPSGLLMFNSGPEHGEAIGTYQGEPLYHSSLDVSEYRSLLHCIGFDVIGHAASDPLAGGRTVWLARSRRQ